MSSSPTLLDTISSTQANKEVVVNSLLDAASPSMLWGRHASACSGLTWGYYGGNYQVGATANAIANGTLTLTASTTNYVYADPTTGAVSVNTTGFPAGKVPLYSIVTGPFTATSYTDERSYQPSATANVGGGTVTSVALAAPAELTVSGSPVTASGTLTLTWAAQAANKLFAGPASGASATPGFRSLVAADLPVMVASGASHAAGAVPDPGATAGTAKFLREDATWAVPSGSGGGSVTSGANFGTGAGQIYDAADTTGTTIAFKTIKAGSNITITNNAQDVTIAASGGGSTPVEKTANYTAVAGDVIAANTSGGSFTITLPASPSAGQSVQILDEIGTWGINPISINPNGASVQRLTETLTFYKTGAKLNFVYQGATNGWLMDGADVAPVFEVNAAITQIAPGIDIYANGRGFSGNPSSNQGTWSNAKSESYKSSGALYFEFKFGMLNIASGVSPMVGVVGTDVGLTAALYANAHGWSVWPAFSSQVSLYNNNASIANASGVTFAAGDVLGFAINFSTGAITIYKNNTSIISVTGQTFPPSLCIACGASVATTYGACYGIFSTRAAHCTYSPPSGYSYWDN